jgi:phosphatidylglycerol:prolipoprotein diacylglycerol transferase
MFPKIFAAGDFFLPTYGVLVAAGFLTALWLAGRLGEKAGLDREKVTNLGVYAALSGLAGAKALMLANDFGYYAANPREIFSMATLQAGGVFYGGLIAALLVGYVYMKKNGLRPAVTLDAFAPGLGFGQAIGRLGCFAAGCCWGVACDRAWAVRFTDPEAQRLVGVPLEVALHPTQLYEAVLGAMIGGAVLWRHGKTHRPGQMIGLYLALSGAARFGVEFVRAHDHPNPMGGALSLAQWISVGLVAAGLGMVWGKRGGVINR